MLLDVEASIVAMVVVVDTSAAVAVEQAQLHTVGNRPHIEGTQLAVKQYKLDHNFVVAVVVDNHASQQQHSIDNTLHTDR